MTKEIIERNIYLSDVPRTDALDLWLGYCNCTPKFERIPISNSLHRILGEAIFSLRSVPHYHASAMDGIAVVADRTYGADEHSPIILEKDKDYVFVDTGNAIPTGFNAVIMIEEIQLSPDGNAEIRSSATPWQHIRPIGEDFLAGDLLFPAGHSLRPVDLGLLLAAGFLDVLVVKKPLVHIIPTGNEIVNPGDVLPSGKITEFNGTVFAASIEEWGGMAEILPIVKDDPELIKEAVLNSVSIADLVILNAGSSAGSRDYTVQVLRAIGEVYVHGVATRPGKPVILGKVNNTSVVGLPGYPISAYLGLDWFVKPFIYKYLKTRLPDSNIVRAKLGRRLVSSMGKEDFIRVNIGYMNGTYMVYPRSKAAGVISSVVRADGWVTIPPHIVGYEQGEEIKVELLKSVKEIQDSVFITGSHDCAIDILQVTANNANSGISFISSHVGSMAGILAIGKGEAHMAGIHLLDPNTGTYNESYVNKLLRGMELVRLPFLKRMQGWIVPKGNPNKIRGIQDIINQKVPYVNRQKGAGTRILFDLLLKENRIPSDSVVDYQREFFNHMSVAAEVKASGGIGMGIASAAEMMGCDFIPVQEESYDWLMTKEFFASVQGQKIFELLKSDSFIASVEKMAGYRVERNLQPIYE